MAAGSAVVYMPGTLDALDLDTALTRAGMSMVELAARCGVPPSTVRAWRAGRHEPHVSAARMVARVLGVSLDRLYFAGEYDGEPDL